MMEYIDDQVPTEVLVGRINSILATSAINSTTAPKVISKPKSFKWAPEFISLTDGAKQTVLPYMENKRQAKGL